MTGLDTPVHVVAGFISSEDIPMDLFQIDDHGCLYISPDIDDWEPVKQNEIRAIFDLDGNLDLGIPEIPGQMLYVYFPFDDKGLPDLERLHAIARLGATLVKDGVGVLSHCGMGHNRSALLAGVMLTYMGKSGAEAVELLRMKRQGALYNKVYAEYLEGLPPAPNIVTSAV